MSVTLRARVDAEDIAQDILADIHSGLARFQEEDAEHFFRWIFRVAENRIADAARYHGAGKRRPDRTPPRPQTTPSVAAARREDAELLRRAVAGLDEAHRDVLRLRRLEERPYEEVAQILEIPEAVARVRYFRALKALRRALLGQGTIRDS